MHDATNRTPETKCQLSQAALGFNPQAGPRERAPNVPFWYAKKTQCIGAVRGVCFIDQ
jgi:hypothetical protein